MLRLWKYQWEKYSEEQLIHTFLDNFQQGGRCSAQIASYQVELRIEENCGSKITVFILFANLLSEFGQFRASYRKSKLCILKCGHCGGSQPT